jgi:hypothetical protein
LEKRRGKRKVTNTGSTKTGLIPICPVVVGIIASTWPMSRSSTRVGGSVSCGGTSTGQAKATEAKKDVRRRDFMVKMEHEKVPLGASNPSGWHDILYTFAFSQKPRRRTSDQGRNSRNSSEYPTLPMLCFVVLPPGRLSIKSNVAASNTKLYASNLAPLAPSHGCRCYKI